MHSRSQYTGSNQYHLQFPVTDFKEVKNKMLNWAEQFSIFCFLDNHQYQVEPHSLECILGAGVNRSFKISATEKLDSLQRFIDEKRSWLFGHLSYDLKNELEELTSLHPDHVGFPDMFFFEPSILIRLTETTITIEGKDAELVYEKILHTQVTASYNPSVNIRNRIGKNEYLEILENIKKHIHRGDCYELNFCQEFYSSECVIEPVQVYRNLSDISPNPFSALYKLEDKYLICASPERYLRKVGSSILSQPIKGTSTRYPENVKKDVQSKNDLSASAKDRSENVMIVDLVRNDLSRVCVEGSVQVDELYGIYSFPQVHQMISTVSGTLRDQMPFTDIIRATFPMGSMTGAPKRKVMELIEKFERTKRGIFSGAVGYIDPEGDFDLNVVIRSIMYNKSAEYVSFQAGSGITFYSDPVLEYDECLLKAEAMKSVLSARQLS